VLPQLALNGTPTPAESAWMLGLCAGFGVLLAFALTRFAAEHQVDPVKGAIGRYFSQRLGRRGTLLSLLGLGYGLYGAGQFLSGPSTRFGDLGPLTGAINSHAIGWLWIVGGGIGFIVGLRPRREQDGPGFVSVFIPLAVWSCLYHVSWITGAFTDDTFGNSRAWVTSIVWSVQTLVILVISGWPDPELKTGRGDE
jgi:hypothetical protein